MSGDANLVRPAGPLHTVDVNRSALTAAWYRLRTTMPRRRSGYLAVVLLIGVVGGTSMASVAAARRTQSSFPKFLARSKPSDLVITVYGLTPTGSGMTGAVPDITPQVSAIPGVDHVEHMVGLNGALDGPGGAPRMDLTSTGADTFGSIDGLDVDQDRPAVVQGRMSNPARADEFVTSAVGAKAYKIHLGQRVTWDFYSNDQSQLPGFGTAKVQPLRRLKATLVGIVVFDNEVVQDDVDRSATSLVFTPAFTKPLVAAGGIGGGGATYLGIRLRPGASLAEVEQRFSALLPRGAGFSLHAGAPVAAKVDRAVKPLAIALGVFGAIAALATLLIALQAISRQIRSSDVDLAVLRALGAGPMTTMADGLVGMLVAVVTGAAIAVVVAVSLSPLSPLGPVRRVYPTPGVAADWTVLGGGAAVLVGVLGLITLALCLRGAPHRVARRARGASQRSSTLVRMASTAGLPVSGVVGTRFAFEPGRGRTAVPVRSTLLANVLAVATLVATLTFASSLHTLISRPPLYGWNWDYNLSGSNSVPPQARALLDHDHLVAGWTGFNSLELSIDGVDVPVLSESGTGGTDPPRPPILSGRSPHTAHEVVLGASTLADLHKHVGDHVTVTYGRPGKGQLYVPPTSVTVVGTATMPAVGQAFVAQDHTSMGVGAWGTGNLLPASVQKMFQDPNPTLNGPNMVFVRMQHGVSPAAGKADMRRITDAAARAFALVAGGRATGENVATQTVQRPAEIVNYRSMGSTPAVLAAGLTIGAVVSLGLTLASSVRRRRRDLALLKCMGFTRRQLSAAVAWHASLAALVGIVVGVPLGVGLGRQFWILFARDIHAVPQPTVPIVTLIVVAVGGVLLANLVSAIPGRLAARTPTALLLHAE